MCKTLLVVGAGFGLVPAIKKAKELGFKVCTVDKNPDAPGMQTADISYDIDVKDKEAILKVAEKNNPLMGSMTLQSEFVVPALGYMNDKINLNGIFDEWINEIDLPEKEKNSYNELIDWKRGYVKKLFRGFIKT